MSKETVNSQVTIYIVHHEKCQEAYFFTSRLFDWFRLGYLVGDSSGAGLPVYFRRCVKRVDPDKPAEGYRIDPEIVQRHADLTVVILLVDHQMVVDPEWRSALTNLTCDVEESHRRKASGDQRIEVLPVALNDSFFRTGRLQEQFNCVRLPQADRDIQLSALRRAATELTARALRSKAGHFAGQLNVFLSHAKRDGRAIAERLRDGIQQFGQLEPWYDANDLAFGQEFEKEIGREAVQTAAMIAIVTDSYSDRPWCRFEARKARWPVVAVVSPGSSWSRALPMLEGVPRIGWNHEKESVSTELIVDRLVLEMMLAQVNRKVADDLRRVSKDKEQEICFITWVPDSWSLLALREALDGQQLTPGGSDGRRRRGTRSAKIRKIIYPGYGLSRSELRDLQPAIAAFSSETRLVSFEEHWQSIDWNDEQRISHTAHHERLLVALSTEAGAKSLQTAGLGTEHCEELLMRVVSSLLTRNQRVALNFLGREFAQRKNDVFGSLKTTRQDGVPALADHVINAALNWQSELADLRVLSGGKTSRTQARRELLVDQWHLKDYVAWPYFTSIPLEDRAKYVGICELEEVFPSDLSPQETERLATDLNDATARRRHADALRELCKQAAEECDLRVVWGGDVDGRIGWWPQILEEVYWTLKETDPSRGQRAGRSQGKPLLILGGFGGCAGLLANYLGDSEQSWPEALRPIADPERDAQLPDQVQDSFRTLFDDCKNVLQQYRHKLLGEIKKIPLRLNPADPRDHFHNQKVRGISRWIVHAALRETSQRKAIYLVLKAVEQLRAAKARD
jgi:hypothetical protein